MSINNPRIGSRSILYNSSGNDLFRSICYISMLEKLED
jgi:hypothetical protein